MTRAPVCLSCACKIGGYLWEKRNGQKNKKKKKKPKKHKKKPHTIETQFQLKDHNRINRGKSLGRGIVRKKTTR